MKTFQIPAELKRYRSLINKMLQVSFETSELTPEQMANIHYFVLRIIGETIKKM